MDKGRVVVKEKRDGESPLYYATNAKKQKKIMEYLKETKNKQDENEIPKETYIQQIYIHANYVA